MNQPFNYDLPLNQIAQRPIHPYDSAKALVVGKDGNIFDSIFSSTADLFAEGDLFIFNNTRVIPARLHGEFIDTGDKIELLLLESSSEVDDDSRWKFICKPHNKILNGTEIKFGDLVGQVIQQQHHTELEISFTLNGEPASPLSVGNMPIPHYIRSGTGDEEDLTDYQTPFADHDGSVAAPTASLHFTDEVVRSLLEKGCGMAFVILHLGSAEYLSPESDHNKNPVLPPEKYRVSNAMWDKIQEVKGRGGRIVAVGASVVRALETAGLGPSYRGAGFRETNLTILPGHKFEVVDAIITNFHQPGSCDLALLEAFLEKETLERVYNHALSEGYRFLCYGDGIIALGW